MFSLNQFNIHEKVDLDELLLEERMLLNVNLFQHICSGRTTMKFNILIKNLQNEENGRLPVILFYFFHLN